MQRQDLGSIPLVGQEDSPGMASKRQRQDLGFSWTKQSWDVPKRDIDKIWRAPIELDK